MYVYVLYRNLNCWTDFDGIWNIGGPQGQEGSWGCFNPVPPPPGTGCIKGVLGVSEASAGLLEKTL